MPALPPPPTPPPPTPGPECDACPSQVAPLQQRTLKVLAIWASKLRNTPNNVPFKPPQRNLDWPR